MNIETPYGKWTAFGFIPLGSDFDPELAAKERFNKSTNLKLGTVLEFQRQIREHIKELLTKVEDPVLRREIDEINYIYIHLLEHI